MSKRSLPQICNKSLKDSKAENLLVLDVTKISSFADTIIIATASSNRHAISVSEKLVDCLKSNKYNILGVEGESDSGWILVDCADGFGGGQDKEKKITIMADSAIGSFGMLALILVMGLRILMLSSLPSTTEIATGIIICAVISRFSMVGYLCFLPAAKQEGLGNQASADNISSLFFAAIVALPAFYFGVFSFVYVIISMLVIALFWGIIAKYQIGGQTGDVCGAGQLLSETMGWVMLASIYAV